MFFNIFPLRAPASWVKDVPWNRWKGGGEADGHIPDEKAVDVEVGSERNRMPKW